MPFAAIAPAIISGAAALGSTGMGIANAAARNKKQYNYQRELMDASFSHNINMAMFNKKQQIELWKETGATAQMEQLRKAGLNPGLIYGMGGAGGQTAAAAPGQGTSTPQAPKQDSGADFGILGLQLASQLNLTKAQIENIKADTEQTRTETAKTAGVDTREAESRIQQIEQGIATSKAQEALTKVQTSLSELDRIYKDATLETNIAKATTELETGYANLKTAVSQSDITAASKENIIETYRLAAIEGALRNDLLKVQKRQGESQINVNEAQIQKMGAEVLQGWKQLSQGDTKLAIDQFNAVIKANYPGITQVMGKVSNSFIESLFKITTGDNSWKPENMK